LAGKAEAVASEARKRFQTTPVFGSESPMSTPTDWKRIEELAEKAEAILAELSKFNLKQVAFGINICGPEVSQYMEAVCNAAPDMAARLRRLSELLGPQLSRNAVFANSTWRTDDAAKVDLHLSVSAVRELLALLTGEEGEGK
jgi:hypothetical protein